MPVVVGAFLIMDEIDAHAFEELLVTDEGFTIGAAVAIGEFVAEDKTIPVDRRDFVIDADSTNVAKPTAPRTYAGKCIF